MPDADRDDDLRDRLDELEATLDGLRAQLDDDHRRRAPGPVDWMRRTTAEVGIPATIAALEANIRLLESLQRGLRRDEVAAARGARSGDRGRDAPFDAIDRALADLQAAVEGGDLPGQPEARRLVGEARRLNAEVRDRTADRPAAPDDTGDGEAITIDVEAELDAIRDEVDDEDE